MEDQRNWTDASYKTYSRPLDLPFPYTVAAGEHVRQRLVLTAGAPTSPNRVEAADAAPAQAAAPEAEELTWRRGGAVPAIGTGHLDLELADPNWAQRLDAALTSHDELALWIVPASPADPAVLAALGHRLAAAVRDGTSFRFLGIADAARHVTTPELAAALREIAPEGVPLAAGARSHFTELNREWETVLAAEPEALAFATTPLFHTLETEQLIEAVAMQRLLAEQLTARVPALPVHIGPITLRPRFANVATRPQPVPAPAPPADPRCRHGAARGVDGRERGGARGPGGRLADLRAGARAARGARRHRARHGGPRPRRPLTPRRTPWSPAIPRTAWCGRSGTARPSCSRTSLTRPRRVQPARALGPARPRAGLLERRPRRVTGRAGRLSRARAPARCSSARRARRAPAGAPRGGGDRRCAGPPPRSRAAPSPAGRGAAW
jgi:hypothetical protein